tara:strand:+ start:362 stop:1186 length:825 start_codon:yes stop_codon:yes gene_type:complete
MKISRRRFFKKLFILSTTLIILVYIDSYWFEKYIIDWDEYDLSKSKKNKIKIIQISDLHLKGLKYFHKTVAERINKEQPDVIAFTGDTISRRNTYPILIEFLDLIDEKILKIAILGNKEYDARATVEDLNAIFKNYNGLVLRNKNYVLTKGERAINILGIDDFLHGKPDFINAIMNINKSLDTIVLNHCPGYSDTIDELNVEEKLNIKMILSGHTHGGQITFFGIKIFTPDGSGNYLKGWYNLKTTKMYVSKGIGTTVIPLRFFARAEATIFHI